MTSHVSSSATINKIYLILLRRSKAFQWRQNRFEILQHTKNSGEGFHLPPPPSCTMVGLWFCVYVRGLSGSFKIWQGSGWFCLWLHFFIKASFILCHERQYFSFFLAVLFQEHCFPSVSVTSNSNFSFKIVWPASVHQPVFEIWNTSSEEFVRGFSRLLVCQIPFNNWWVIRGENVYTGRFPFKWVFASMIAFSHFSLNVVPWYTTVSKKIVSVSDISAVNFIVGWCVSLLVPWTWRNLRCLVYFCPTGE